MNEEKEEFLDFDGTMQLEKLDLTDEIETLDIEVSNEIDNMLDFLSVSSKDKKQVELPLEEEKETNISNEALQVYTPSIKDFNIKSAKKRKIVKKCMLYVIIVMLLGFELFINKTGDILNNLKVYASNNEPIKIVQNEKYGFIDYMGNKLVNPKYIYAEDFIKGYAIVKDSSNLPLIINRGGKEVVPTGKYFSLFRADEYIIASKVTKKGLKYGILNSNLKEISKFQYDQITYLKDVYSFSKGNSVGLINKDGKEIYEYKLADNIDKVINVKISNVNDNIAKKYAVVKVNSSSQIVNIEDGSIVTSATLNEIVPEDNNVFYEVVNGNRNYFYIEDNEVVIESDTYSSMKIESIASGIIRALTKDYKYEFISTKTGEQIKKNLREEQTIYGENIFMYKDYDVKSRKNIIVLVKNGEVLTSIENIFTEVKAFKNGFAIIKFSDNTYSYLNEEGKIITDIRFLEVQEFDKFGHAIAKTNDGYGVIDKEGKVIIDFKYEEIKMANTNVKVKAITEEENVFFAAKKSGFYNLYNSKGKKVNNIDYINVEFNENYPILKLETDYDDSLYIPSEKVSINLTNINAKYDAYENYIIVKNEYYNYKGKVIYIDKSLES